jgi:hypothetical protein
MTPLIKLSQGGGIEMYVFSHQLVSLPFPSQPFPFVPIIVQVTHIDPKKYMCTYVMMHESHRMKLNGGGT